MASRLKIKSKEERQLTFNRNSELKMKEVLNKYLDRIILDILHNFSSFSREMGALNYLESLVGEKNGHGGVGSKEINDMKLKFTKDSTWGEILKICRD